MPHAKKKKGIFKSTPEVRRRNRNKKGGKLQYLFYLYLYLVSTFSEGVRTKKTSLS